MNLRKITFALLVVLVTAFSCGTDDGDTFTFVPRDSQEVYDENIAEIEAFLATHTYNYDEFDFANPYSLANDTFKIVFDTISEANNNLDAIALLDRPELLFKTVTQGDVDYKLYYLNVREGLGQATHPLDAVNVTYNGTLLDGTEFDGADVDGLTFNLSSVGSSFGVVDGFREALIEFRMRDGYTENGDGTTTNHNYGIGAVFIPSGLGYFSTGTASIPSYSPINFTFGLLTRIDTDYDLDSIPSHLEDLDGDGDGLNEDTDGDGVANFIDNDDDNDGVLTIDEDIDQDGDPTNDDTDGDGIPNYLDYDTNLSN
ncbi:FKBP-type peptidyl-prolyl cis-trans isomerase [Olleya marilimosa]|jgi:hypothetical protein|uniref:peptidylprolyl isomerase n=1 Tax=Olleya marilimosa TaxID=272164 RepID=A0ABR8LX45_9FLAO|nr:hypothetical protein [Olleya marilimosa]MBD3863664.1 hypothetical protein [Olleya marilimosa]|tara:strand:+ start:321633 stop:322574 length:942 start_codon:yes stop_codon:yes gene_type:complete